MRSRFLFVILLAVVLSACGSSPTPEAPKKTVPLTIVAPTFTIPADTSTPTVAPTATSVPPTASPTHTPAPTKTQAPLVKPSSTKSVPPTAAVKPTKIVVATAIPAPEVVVQPTVVVVPTEPPPAPTTSTGGGGHGIFGGKVDPAWWPCLQGQIKGNQNSKIYHWPTARDYARTYENVACFNTTDEAAAAGFRPAKR
jgi:hypothetical protein